VCYMCVICVVYISGTSSQAVIWSKTRSNEGRVFKGGDAS